mgnify:CR=1 FL=1
MRKVKDEYVKRSKKKNPLRELFGALKFNAPTKKILKEVRRKESKFLQK